MNSQTIKNLFLILFMLASLGSCLELEQKLDEESKLCHPLVPFLQMFESPQTALDQAQKILDDLSVTHGEYSRAEDLLQHLITDGIFTEEKLTQNQIAAKMNGIAEAFVEGVRKNIESPETIDALLEIAVDLTKKLAIKDLNGQIKSQPKENKNTSLTNRNYNQFLKVEINNYIVNLSNEKTIDHATYEKLNKLLDLDNKLKKQEDTFSRILKRFRNSACLHNNLKSSLFVFISQLLGQIERSPNFGNPHDVNKQITELTTFWLDLATRDGADENTQNEIQVMTGMLFKDIYEIENSGDLRFTSNFGNTNAILRKVAEIVLGKLGNLNDIDYTISILRVHASNFMPNIHCENFKKNFKEAFLHPHPGMEKFNRYTFDFKKEQQAYVTVTGALYYSSEKETDFEFKQKLIDNASVILNLRMDKKPLLEALIPALCDSQFIKFSDNDFMFQFGLGQVIKTVFTWRKGSDTDYAGDFQRRLAEQATHGEGVYRVYSEFLELSNLFRLSGQIPDEMKRSRTPRFGKIDLAN